LYFSGANTTCVYRVSVLIDYSSDAEANRLCNAQRYERSDARRDTRAGHYERNLQTKAGEVRLKGSFASRPRDGHY
jgi:transposase-like protein